MVHSCNLATAVVGTLQSVLLLEEHSIDDAADGDDDDDDIKGERSHGLVAELHVLAAEAVNHVRHGFVVDDVLLVGVLQPGPELLQAAALGLLRQRPVVEPPRLLLLSTLYTSRRRMNFCDATLSGSVVVSGWYSLDSRRYAALISSMSASGAIPRNLGWVITSRVICLATDFAVQSWNMMDRR
jgi:hypothetical protein